MTGVKSIMGCPVLGDTWFTRAHPGFSCAAYSVFMQRNWIRRSCRVTELMGTQWKRCERVSSVVNTETRRCIDNPTDFVVPVLTGFPVAGQCIGGCQLLGTRHDEMEIVCLTAYSRPVFMAVG